MAVFVTVTVQSEDPKRTVQPRPISTPVQSEAPETTTVQESEP